MINKNYKWFFSIVLVYFLFICNSNNSNSNNVVSSTTIINNNNRFVNFKDKQQYNNCSLSQQYTPLTLSISNSDNEYSNNNNNENNKDNKDNNNNKLVKEYIIMFRKYIDQKEHQTYLNEIFKKIKSKFEWKVIARNNPASKYPSDFALVEISVGEITKLQSLDNYLAPIFETILKQHESTVKYIFPERRIDESMLKKWQTTTTTTNNNEDNEDDEDITTNNDLKSKNISILELKTTFNGKIHDEIPEEVQEMFNGGEYNSSVGRKLKSINDHIQITDLFETKKLWDSGYRGGGVKVAIFDTGLSKDHPHFNNIVNITDWTKENNTNDMVGHGTFVAGVIGSSNEKCLGFAPDAKLYVFRVFNSHKVSFTSWFIDAFNHAIVMKMDVLNLSIGGPDFMDKPFVEKVWEMSANNIIVVSAIGNDGPLYGTLNNPADQLDVIGVGGIDYSDTLSSFSSRGMTTWELPEGYGRVKPDIVAYGSSVYGSSFKGDVCRPLSGTSVSSPVVTGAITVLLSSVKDKSIINPASIKQVLIESAEKIKNAGIFEQGSGKLNLLGAKSLLDNYKPKISFSPSQLDFLPSGANGNGAAVDCPYLWPYCTQKLYHTSMPIIVNATIINGVSVSGEIVNAYWNASRNGNHLNVTFSYQPTIWPWTGHIGIFFTVPEESSSFNGVAEGSVDVTIATISSSGKIQYHTIHLPVRVQIIPKPPRERRILWDQFHNLRYPLGFFPRDSLEIKNEPFDWNGDHIHTNFRKLYTKLVSLGYFVEVIGSPLTCFDPLNYGTLLIVDSEEEFLPSEIKKIEEDVRNHGLNLIVFADWYNTEVMKLIEFHDDNTQQLWSPATGGANIPALNDFLSVFGIYFGDSIYNGEFIVGDKVSTFSSGTSIIGFPAGGKIFEATLVDQTRLITKGRTSQSKIPVLGFFQPTTMENENSLDQSSSYSGSSNIEDSSLIYDDDIDEISGSGSGSGGDGDNNNINVNLQKKRKNLITNNGATEQSSSNTRILSSGHVVVFGDSNCLDESHQKDKSRLDCYWLIEDILNSLKEGSPSISNYFPNIGTLHRPLLPISKSLKQLELPNRSTDLGSIKEMKKFSKIVGKPDSTKLAMTCGNQVHPNQFPNSPWNNLDKYLNITWENRDKVIPSLVVPHTNNIDPYSNEDISSNFAISGYIAICFVVILLIVLFFKDKSRKQLNNNNGGIGSNNNNGGNIITPSITSNIPFSVLKNFSPNSKPEEATV